MSKGRAKIICENESIQINEGDIFFIPKGAAYKSFWYGEPEIVFSLSFPYLADFEEKGYSDQLLPHSQNTVRKMYKILGEEKENAVGVGRLCALLAELMPHFVSNRKRH